MAHLLSSRVRSLPVPAGLALYRSCTNRQDPPTTQAREAWCTAGRRAGKSRLASVIAIYLAAFRDYADVLSVGEVGTLPVVAADRRQARTCMQYISGLLDETPMLAALVVDRSADSVELSTGVRIEIHTASWRALRGYTVVGCVLDEVCFWRSEDSSNPDHEIVNAVRPAMVTVPHMSTSTSLTERVRAAGERRGFTEDQVQYDPLLRSMIEHVAGSEERAAAEDELAAAFAEVGAQHGLSPHVYSERCEIARIMARGRHAAYQRHRRGG